MLCTCFIVVAENSETCMDKGSDAVCRMESASDGWLKMMELYGKSCSQVSSFL